MISFRTSSWMLLLCLSQALLFSACGKSDAMPECGPKDQRSSYMPPLPEGDSVSVRIDSKFFSGFPGAQREEIIRAMGIWNDFSTRNLRYEYFKMRSDSPAESGRVTHADDLCRGADESSHVSIMVEDSEERWLKLVGKPGDARAQADTSALTLRCATESQATRQVIIINPRRVDPRNLVSIALHELGHAIGLDHSCKEGKGADNYIGCDRLTSSHPYFSAIMYPWVQVTVLSNGMPHVKEALTRNDEERAYCRSTGDDL